MAGYLASNVDEPTAEHGDDASDKGTLCSASSEAASNTTGQLSTEAKLSAFTAPVAFRNSGAFVHATKFKNLESILEEGLRAARSDIYLIDEVRKDGRVPGLSERPEILILIDEVKSRTYNMQFHYDAEKGIWTTHGIDGVIRPWFFQKVVDQRPRSRGNVLFQSKDDPLMHNVMKGSQQPPKLIHATYWENVPGILRDGLKPAKNPKGAVRRRIKGLLQGAEDHVYTLDERAMNAQKCTLDADQTLSDTKYNADGTIFGLDRQPDALIAIDTKKAAALGYELEMVQSSDRMGTVFVKGHVPPECLSEPEPNEPVELPDNLKAKIVNPKSFDVVPIVDLSMDDDVIMERLKFSCEVVGFMQVVGHGISEELLQRHVDLQRRFFEMPADVKESLSLNAESPVRGYFGLGGEDLDKVLGDGAHQIMDQDNDGADGKKQGRRTSVYTEEGRRNLSGVKSKKDNKESLDMNGVPWSQPVGDRVAKMFAHPSRLLPDEVLPGFKQTMEEYANAVFALSQRLLRFMARIIGKDADFFEAHLTRPVATHRLLHYWPIADYQTQIGVGAHTDYGLLTILQQDSTGGLQVLNAKEQRWVHALPIQNAFVVNIGDMLDTWTGHRFKSTIHRVVNTSPEQRYSSPFFLEPNLETVIALGGICSEGMDSANAEPGRSAEEILEGFYRASGQLKDYDADS